MSRLHVRTVVALAIAVITLPACRSSISSESPLATEPPTPALVSLSDSVEPLRRRFNDSNESPQFVALLSSTCGQCVAGGVAVDQTVVRAFRDADIALSIVWMGCVMEGLRKYYKRRSSSGLYRVSLLFIVLYSIVAALYIIFNSVPNLTFPGKDQAVFGVEMAMLGTGATFVALLILHGRWVTYIIQVKK